MAEQLIKSIKRLPKKQKDVKRAFASKQKKSRLSDVRSKEEFDSKHIFQSFNMVPLQDLKKTPVCKTWIKRVSIIIHVEKVEDVLFDGRKFF